MPAPTRDTPEIDDSDTLYRRVLSYLVERDDKGVAIRATHRAFRDPPDQSDCSVYSHAMLVAHGLTVESIMVGHEAFGLVAFKAGDARKCGFGVFYTADPSDPGHAELTGDKTDIEPRKRLAESTAVVVQPRP